MKYSPLEVAERRAEPGARATPGFRPWVRVRELLAQFKRDLRTPLPETEGKPLRSRIRARCVFLYRRYGWKLVVGLIVYYLVRDVTLYIIVPYFVARQLL